MMDDDTAPGAPGGLAARLPKSYGGQVNAADEAALHRSATREKDQRRREANDLRDVMSMPQGRRVMWRILVKAGVYSDGFTGDNRTFFNEGRRSIGLQLMAELEAAAKEHFIDMWQENGFTHD
jgi:hypothetical protein